MGTYPGLHHGTVDQELLLRNEYLAAENRILRGQLKGRLKLSDAERARLGEIGHRLGADAILDRIIHNAYKIELAGDSMRKRRMLEPSA